MENLVLIKKEDVEIFRCPISIKLNELYDYFIFSQENMPLCSITAVISLIEYLRQKEGKKYEKLSVGFLYHNALLANGNKNIGLKASSVLKAILEHGTCLQKNWKTLNSYIEPSEEANIEALSRIKHCTIENIELSIETIRFIIGFCERPIVAIFNIYDRHSFFNRELSRNTIHKPPTNSNIESRHSILLVGYDDNQEILIFQNSYGEEWGINGFGTISYDYIPYFSILYSMDESCIKSDGIEE